MSTKSCNSSVRIDGTWGCVDEQNNSLVAIPPTTPNSIIVFDSNPIVKGTKTSIDSNGSIYENINIFSTGFPNDALSNVTHDRIFFQTLSTTSVQTAPISYDDLVYVNSLPHSYFATGQTLKVLMRGTLTSGVSNFKYGVRFNFYDVQISLDTIVGPSGLGSTPYDYEMNVVFRSDVSIVYASKFSYIDTTSNTYKSFCTNGGPTAIDQTASTLLKISANTALVSPDNNNIINCDICQFSYS